MLKKVIKSKIASDSSDEEKPEDNFSLQTVEQDVFKFEDTLKHLCCNFCNGDIENVNLAKNEEFVPMDLQDDSNFLEVVFPCYDCVRTEEEQDKWLKSKMTEKAEVGRGHWTNRTLATLACISAATGTLNLVSFGFLMLTNGGGAFLIPYTIMMALCAVPMMIQELGVGQFSGYGVVRVYKMARLFTGIGASILFMTWLSSLYYGMYVTYTLSYIFDSFQTPLPWGQIRGWWNKNTYWKNNPNGFREDFYGESPALEYFKYRILKVSDGLTETGKLDHELTLCLALTWIFCCCCIMYGLKTLKRVIYFTNAMKFVLLLAFFIKALTLDGATLGISALFAPEWSKIGHYKAWWLAGMHAFYTLDLSNGAIITIGSYNLFHLNFVKQAVITAVVTFATSLISSISVMSVMGHSIYKIYGLTYDSVQTAQTSREQILKWFQTDNPGSGELMAFVNFAQGATFIKDTYNIWTFVFFFLLLFFSIDTLMIWVHLPAAFVITQWYEFAKRRRFFLAFSCCLISFLCSLLMVSESGYYWFYLLQKYAFRFASILVAILFTGLVNFGYGYAFTVKWRFEKDFQLMRGYEPNNYLRFCWRISIPMILFFLLVTEAMNFEWDTKFGKERADRRLGNSFAYLMALIPPLALSVCAIYYILTVYHDKFGLEHAISLLCRPTHDWQPQDPACRAEYKLLVAKPVVLINSTLNNADESATQPPEAQTSATQPPEAQTLATQPPEAQTLPTQPPEATVN